MTRIVGVVSTLVCATSKYLEQTNTHSNAFETAPVGLAGARRSRVGCGSAFFREMTGSRNREKNYGGVAGGWFPGTIVDGWRDREEIIAGTGIQDSGPLQGPPISGNFKSFYRVLPALLVVVGDPSWLKKW